MQNSNNNLSLTPFLKWAGGKRQLLPEIKKYIPSNFRMYYEPFVGAGAVFLDLKHEKAIVNDINSELINTYKVIKNSPYELISLIETFNIDEKTFYEIREMDRDPKYHDSTEVFKAARMIYLNRLCFNGLYRVNSKGYFNVPYGKYKNPRLVNKELIINLSKYFSENDIKFLNVGFEEAILTATNDDFIYFDPPYDPLSVTSSFTSYSVDSFGKNEQIILSELFKSLTSKKVKVLLSNSNTPFINELYRDFKINIVNASRNINSKGSQRGAVKEVLISNY